MPQERRPVGRRTAVAVAVFTTLLAGTGAYFVVRWVIRAFSQVPKETSAAIITGTATIIVALVTVFIGRALERRVSFERAQQEKRIPVYEDFLSGLFRIFQIGIPKEKRAAATEEEILHVLTEFTTKGMVWASDQTLKEWSTLKVYFMQVDESRSRDENIRGLLLLENLILALRKDLGLSNKKLQAGDLMRLIINDWDGSTPNKR